MKTSFINRRVLLGLLLFPIMNHTGLAEDAMAQPEKGERLHLPEFIAHRGASYLAPENTLASIQLAWNMDVDAVEIDIYLTADDEIVVYHDKTTNRIGGRDKAVEDQTLAELRELDLGEWKGPQWKGEKIATLDEALATLPKGKRMIVESKSDIRIVEPMLEAIERAGHHPHQVVVITFLYDVAAKTKKIKPQQQVLWLSGFRQDDATGEWSPTIDELVDKALEANLDGLNLRWIGPATEAEEVQKIREAGLGYYLWTVDDVEDAEQAIDLGVDGLTTNRPAWMKKNLLSRNGWTFMDRPQN